jgi:hypothetical protein
MMILSTSLTQHVVENLSNMCKNYLAMERENKGLAAELADVRRKYLFPAQIMFFLLEKICLLAYRLVFGMVRSRCSSCYRQIIDEGSG